MKITSLLIIVIFTALVLGVIFFWWPKYNDFIHLRATVAERNMEVADKEKHFSELDDVSLKLKEYPDEISKIDSTLPSSAFAIPELVNFLAKKGSQNSLILEKVTVDKTSLLSKDSKVKKIALTVSLSGFYQGLKNFLSDILFTSFLYIYINYKFKYVDSS